MTSDCNDVPGDIAYNCSNPWGWGCKSSEGFNFASLWNYTQSIQKACESDSRLFGVSSTLATPQNAALTQSSCPAIAGSSWRYNPGAEIWTLLTAWKFPLLQLVPSFPRPPLSFWVELFVINHLLGDPIDTIKNLLTKMSNCQRVAKYWREQRQHQVVHGDDTINRGWKALAIITDSYAEWGVEDQAQQILSEECPSELILPMMTQQTAKALAADRATKSLPIAVAQCFFIASVGIAIFRTAAAADSSASSDTVFINVEAHSIAFSALYFWIIPAVFLSSIIGVSQTEANIPRILRKLEAGESRFETLNKSLDQSQRIYHGGVYLWQPSKWQCETLSSWKQNHMLLPYLIVLLGTVTGMTVSALVPPDGIDCRHIAQLSMLFVWYASAELDILLNKVFHITNEIGGRLFWCTYVKDFVATGTTMGCVIATQLGFFNRCLCYTQWGNTGLALPEMPDVATVLRARLGREYPAITFTSIAIELIIVPLAIWLWYGDAMRVYVQRDDGKSNAMWLWDLKTRCQEFITSLKSRFCRCEREDVQIERW